MKPSEKRPLSQVPPGRIALAVSAAWLLAVFLHAIWASASGNFNDYDIHKHFLAAILPLVLGWACLALYVWTVRPR